MTNGFLTHETGSQQGWQQAATPMPEAKTVALPQTFEQIGLGNFDGTAWFRREFVVPADWPRTAATLALGNIDDEDTVWINGVEVGQTHRIDQERHYPVPATGIKPGTNFIAIRVLDTGGGGGLTARPGQLRLTAGNAAADLGGTWQMQATLPYSNQNSPPPPAANPTIRTA